MQRQKYGAVKTKYDGILFASKKEAGRYAELKLLERAGAIQNLRRQVAYELVPTQRDENGKLLERSVDYIADFVYTQNGETVVEDTKGMRTPQYIIKRKLMLKENGIRIREY